MNLDEHNNICVIDYLKRKIEIQDECDAENIFQELSRLTDSKDTRTIDEILSAVEQLMKPQQELNETTKVSKRLAHCQNRCKLKENNNNNNNNNKHMNEFMNSLENQSFNSYINSSKTKEVHSNSDEIIMTHTTSLQIDNENKYDVGNVPKNSVLNKVDSAAMELHNSKYNNCTELLATKKTKVLNSFGCVQIKLDDTELVKNNGNVSKNMLQYEETLSDVNYEYSLRKEIDYLNAKLKRTEDRLESVLMKNESLSQMIRNLRENNTHLENESEKLKIDIQNLHERSNHLQNELQLSREDRIVAINLQKKLQADLLASRQQQKRLQEITEQDQKNITHLQQQCEEMEGLLLHQHPHSVSSFIESVNKYDPEPLKSHFLLEERIAQLETDAKEQDLKAQQILTNVQTRFNSVQAKYETHIADLETQVLSLQEINTNLNEKLESNSLNFIEKTTQTEENMFQNRTPTKTKTCDQSTNTIGALNRISNQASSPFSSCSSTANSTPNNSRPSSKQNGIRKPFSNVSQLSVSQSDSTICSTGNNVTVKENAHLLTNIRAMRIQLALKEKAIQQLSRELEDSKKTMKRLQREKESFINRSAIPKGKTAQLSLREAKQKIASLESDYKSLNEKRLQDLKTLQNAHKREMAQCSETIRVIKQCFHEYDIQLIEMRKMPVDYYELKDKVISLERRHTEREKRMHDLLEELGKSLSTVKSVNLKEY